MRSFIGFILSVAIVFFIFIYYTGAHMPATQTDMDAVTRSARAGMTMAAAPTVSVLDSSSVTITAERGKWKADTVKYMQGGYFWQQVMIKFSDGVLIEHADGSANNQFYLLNRKDFITGPGENRMLVVLDSLSGRLVWREIIRDGRPLRDAVDTLRVQFLLLRRPQS